MCLLIASSLWSDALAQPQMPAAVKISGDVAHPLTLTVEDLRKLPAQRVEDSRGERSGGPRHYVGVLLRDVLDRAKLTERQPRGLRKSIAVVTAKDGYRTVFSWAELYLSPIGDGVLLVYERDAAPLDEEEGPIALISLKDASPGPRHVKWLQSIDVRSVDN
jgi:DMSO/TMAO reductase YedYZ molybdopterin-dependent catalytic subunit